MKKYVDVDVSYALLDYSLDSTNITDTMVYALTYALLDTSLNSAKITDVINVMPYAQRL